MGNATHCFTTQDFQVWERRDVWHDLISRACCPYRVDFGGAGADSFYGEIDERQITGLKCVRITSNTVSAQRSRREVDRQDPRMLYAILQVRGTARMAQGDEEALLRPGDLTFIDSSRPHKYLYDGPCENLNVHLPRELVVGDRDLATLPFAHAIRGPAAAITGDLMRSVFAHAVDDDSLAIGAVKTVLVTLARSLLLGEDPDAAYDRPMLATVQDYIGEHLHDPALSPARIATATGISVRHLHRLFATTGRTVGDWIRERRLARCARDLSDPALRHVSVTEICYRWGFNDSAHFSRSFKAEFGRAPRAYRSAAALAEPAPRSRLS